MCIVTHLDRINSKLDAHNIDEVCKQESDRVFSCTISNIYYSRIIYIYIYLTYYLTPWFFRLSSIWNRTNKAILLCSKHGKDIEWKNSLERPRLMTRTKEQEKTELC